MEVVLFTGLVASLCEESDMSDLRRARRIDSRMAIAVVVVGVLVKSGERVASWGKAADVCVVTSGFVVGCPGQLRMDST